MKKKYNKKKYIIANTKSTIYHIFHIIEFLNKLLIIIFINGANTLQIYDSSLIKFSFFI